MPKEDSAERRDEKRRKQRYGMRVVGRSVRDTLSHLINWTPKKKKRRR